MAWVINTYVIDNEVQLGLNWSSIGLQANLTGSHSFTITRSDDARFTSDFVLGELGQRILVAPLRKQVEAEGIENMAKTAVGTGPFTLERDDPGLRVYERIEDHWRVDPAMDELTMLSAPESATRLGLVLSGQADVGKTMDELDVKQATSRGVQGALHAGDDRHVRHFRGSERACTARHGALGSSAGRPGGGRAGP